MYIIIIVSKDNLKNGSYFDNILYRRSIFSMADFYLNNLLVLYIAVLYSFLSFHRLYFCPYRTVNIFNVWTFSFLQAYSDSHIKHHSTIWIPWAFLHILTCFTCYYFWCWSSVSLLSFHFTTIICFILVHCPLTSANSSMLLS